MTIFQQLLQSFSKDALAIIMFHISVLHVKHIHINTKNRSAVSKNLSKSTLSRSVPLFWLELSSKQYRKMLSRSLVSRLLNFPCGMFTNHIELILQDGIENLIRSIKY